VRPRLVGAAANGLESWKDILDRSENAAYARAILLPAVELRRLEQVLIVKTD